MNYFLELTEFETLDHLTLPALLYRSKKSDKAAIYIHGNGSSSVLYDSTKMNLFGSKLALEGISFLTFNNRGASWFMKLNRKINQIEERVVYGMAYELIKECVMDIDGAIAFLKKGGYREFYLIGVSTGANKIVVYHRYKPKNEVAKYILLSGGDDTGLYYDMEFKKNRKKFFAALEKCKEAIRKGHGRSLVPKYMVREQPISYQSLYDTINPDGDYNIFPFNEYMNHLRLSKKSLFKEYHSINKPTLIVYGEHDEYCYGNVPRCVEVLKKECPHPNLFTFKIVKGGDHGFHGKENEMTELVTDLFKF